MPHPFDLILIRGREVLAERIYVSGRGDYIVYRYKNKTYTVRTEGILHNPAV